MPFEAQLLLENLKYLPQLQKLTLQDAALSGEEVAGLQQAYPEIALEYTVEVLGNQGTATLCSGAPAVCM